MNTYKITNITNKKGKRDPKFNSILNIEYVDNRTKKTIKLVAGDKVYLSVQSLPLSIHRLRLKKLVEIEEVSPAELKKHLNASKPKPVVKKPTEKKTEKKVSAKKKTETINEKPEIEKKTSTKKKTIEE